MPHAAEVDLLVLELLHLDDLREADDPLHKRIFNRLADALRESHVILQRKRLVAKEDHQMLEPRLADLAHLTVRKRAQIDIADLGAERAGNALNRQPSHTPLCISWLCSSPM